MFGLKCRKREKRDTVETQLGRIREMRRESLSDLETMMQEPTRLRVRLTKARVRLGMPE